MVSKPHNTDSRAERLISAESEDEMIKYLIVEHRHEQIYYSERMTAQQMIGEDENGVHTERSRYNSLEKAAAEIDTLTTTVDTYSGSHHLLCDIVYYSLDKVEYNDDGDIDDITTIRDTF